MIDAALTPDGSVVLMAHGDAGDGLRVRLDGKAVEILEAGGRLVARTEAMAERARRRLREAAAADVILAGRSGLKGYAAAVEMGGAR